MGLGNAMRALLVALMLMFGSQAGAEDVFYCSSNANLATGFSKQDGQWRTYKFPDRRFSAKKIGNFSSLKINDDMFSCQRPSKDFEPYSITLDDCSIKCDANVECIGFEYKTQKCRIYYLRKL